MQQSDTPFKASWWGIELESAGLELLRPDRGTYAEYDFAALPSLPCTLDGSFAWLRQYDPCDQNIGVERRGEIAGQLSSLLMLAEQRGRALPDAFVTFMRDSALQMRVRSSTDCFIELCAEPVPSPVDDGFLIRFLADSQGCLFWYLYLPGNGAGHCVVVSPGYYGLPEEEWQDTPPDHSEIRYCAESFEVFMCRFVLENEAWLSVFDGTEPGALEKAYVAGYLGVAG